MSKGGLTRLAWSGRNRGMPASKTGPEPVHDGYSPITIAQLELAEPVVQRVPGDRAYLTVRASETKNKRFIRNVNSVEERDRLLRERDIVLEASLHTRPRDMPHTGVEVDLRPESTGRLSQPRRGENDEQ